VRLEQHGQPPHRTPPPLSPTGQKGRLRRGEAIGRLRGRRSLLGLVGLLALLALLEFGVSAYVLKSARKALVHFAPPPAASLISPEGLLAPASVCEGDDSVTASPARQLQAMACLVNWARARDGLTPLAMSAQLTTAAGGKLVADVRCDELSHTPCGAAFTREIDQSGYLTDEASYQVGENIASGTGALGSPRAIMTGWLNSPGHLANILDPSFQQMGLAYLDSAGFLGAADAHLWANDFGDRTSR
jgi:uncharacterized protein YkwD